MAHGSQARLGLSSCASLGPPLARSEKVLPGVEEAVKMMRSGDVWELAVPGNLGFGEKGRSASPGKPRIPANAVCLPPSLPPSPPSLLSPSLPAFSVGGAVANMEAGGAGEEGDCAAGSRGRARVVQPPWPGRHTPRRHTPERGGTLSRPALSPRPLTPTFSRAAQDLTFLVELAAVPGKDEEILDILEAEAEAQRAREAKAKEEAAAAAAAAAS